jgi:hypothetical protein
MSRSMHPTMPAQTAPRLWPTLPQATQHRLACVMAQALRPLTLPGCVQDKPDAESRLR